QITRCSSSADRRSAMRASSQPPARLTPVTYAPSAPACRSTTSSPARVATAGPLSIISTPPEDAERLEMADHQFAALALHGVAHGADALGIAGVDRLPDAFHSVPLGALRS